MRGMGSYVIKRSTAVFATALLLASALLGLDAGGVSKIAGASAATTTMPAMTSSSWQAVRSSTGALLTDATGDFSGYNSVPELDLVAASGDSVLDWYADGTNTMFRLQISGTAAYQTNRGISNGQWLISLGKMVNGAPKTLAWVGVNGGGNGATQTYVYNPATASTAWTDSFSNSSGSATNSAWAADISSPSAKHWIAFQVPTATLTSLGASAGVGFFAGTSKSNSFNSINKDYINALGSSTSPTYSSVQTVNTTTNLATVTAPTITSFTPTGGSTAGGTQVVITGTNLDNLNYVSFGSNNAQIMSSTSTSVTVLTPAGAVGTVQVRANNIAGTVTASGYFTYSASLVGTSLSLNQPTGLVTGNLYTLSATVKNSAGSSTLTAATGSILFKDGNGTLLCSGAISNGTATCNILPLTVTPLTITASYGGDATYGASSVTASATTPTAGATQVVYTAPSPVTTGTTYTMVARVYNSAGTQLLDSSTGTVTFTIGSTQICVASTANATNATFTVVNSTITSTGTGTLGQDVYSSGVANCTYKAWSGNQTITATYVSGDSNFQGSSVSSSTGATKLSTPTITSTSATYNSITVNFGSVSNASSYTVRVYDSTGTILVSNVTGPNTSTSLTVNTGLSASTSYLVTVQAVGDGTSYTNSNESGTTAVNTTAPPVALTTPNPAVSGTPTSTTAVITFTANSNASSVTTTITPSSGVTVPTIAPTDTSVTIRGLTANTSYTFTMKAIGNGTTYTDSAVGQVTFTSGAVVPDAPTGVSASGGNTTATVSWTAPANNGGSAITDYTVQSSTDGSTWSTATHTASTSTSITFTGLTNGVTYQFRVAAVNAIGTGAWSALPNATAVPATTPGTPTGVTATSGNASATVSWTAPSNNGSAITDYTIQYSSNGGSSWSTATHTASTATSITIGGLTNGTAYVFRVAAVNGIGTGSYSTSPYATATPATVPGAPTGVSATSGNGSASVSWTAPASNGGSAITDYTVEYSTNGSTWTVFTHTASTATTMTVTGLTNGTSYQFRVSAVNAVGAGSPTTYSSTVTPYSSVATLSNLATSTGSISPTFASGTSSYSLSVANSVSTITVTPTLTDANASLTVNGNAATSGVASSSIGLNVGVNTVTVRVTAQNGVNTSTYTITITRAPSSDATLAGLTTSVGAPSPTFASLTTSYTLSVAYGVTSLSVRPTVNEPNAVVTVNGTSVTSGSYSGSISLSVGTNTITVATTAQDGSTTSSYTITVTRAHADQAALTITTTSAVYPQTLSLGFSGGSGTGAVTYSVVSGSCTISAGVLTPTAPGSCVIQATRAGDSQYNSVTSASTTITIDRGTQTLSFGTTSYALAYGETQTVSASSTVGTGAITYSDTGSTACTVNPSTGVVTITDATGSCTITASIAQDTNYYGATSSNSVSISVSKATQASLGTITLNASEKAYPYSLTVSVISISGGSGTGSHEITGVANGTATGCTLTAGVLTASSIGTCNLTVTHYGDSHYLDATAIVPFTFKKANQPSLVITSTSGLANQAYILTKSGGAGSGDVRYTTSTANCLINQVGGNYELSLSNTGTPTTCSVTVFQLADDNYFAAQTTSDVGMGTAVSTLTLSLPYGATAASHNVLTTLTATANTAGTVAFKVGGTVIPSCSAVPTAGSFQATCDWTPTTATTGLVLTADFAPTSGSYSAISATDTIDVTTGSLDGLALSDLTNIFKTTTDGTSSSNHSWANADNSTSLSLNIPINAFTALTEINAYLYRGNSAAIATNMTFSSYLLNFVVEWHAMDGSRPSAAHPLELTVHDSRIKAGMGLYAIVGGVAVLQSGRASDGVATFSLANDPGAVITFIAPDAPTSPTAVAGNGTATISWTAPTNTGGSAITSYKVTASDGSSCIANTGTPLATTCTITGLTNGTSYNFTVTATNGAGLTSDPSVATAFVTPSSAPSAPTSLSGTAGDTQVVVNWAAPSDNGSAITGYIVKYSSDGTNWTTLPNTGTTATTLTVTGLTNGLTYQFAVAAVNGIGTSAYSTALTGMIPAGVPAAPTSVVGTVGNGQVSLSWTAPSANGSSITDYLIQYSTDGSNWTAYSRVGTSTLTTATVSSLSNGTSYQFRVAAVNAVGTGAYSVASSSITPATTPGAPTSLSGVSGNAQVTLSWSAPSSNGGSSVTGYVVRYSSDNGSTWSASVDARSSSPFTVTGLTNGTSYVFQIFAINSVGTGSASSTSAAVTPATTPGAPASVSVTATGDSRATVSWTAPVTDGGSSITDYIIRYSTDSGSTWSASVDTHSSSSYTVTGLSNGSGYVFQVFAVNAVGTGPASATTSPAVTPAGLPGTPTALTVTSTGDARVSLSWTAPASNGSSITTYLVEYSTDGGTTWNTYVHTASSATTITLTGLTNGSSYLFRVSAVNSVGTGSSSTQTNPAVTPATVPGAPTGVSGASDNNKVTLSWTTPASDGGSAITDYLIVYSSNGGSTWSATLDTRSSGTSFTVTGLTNGTGYIFKVYAVNAVGNSLASVTSSSVSPSASSITPSTQSVSGTVGTPVSATTAYTPIHFSGTPTYAISAGLPAGLSFDATSGVISGTPTAAQAATNLTVTASYLTESATATVSITVVSVPGAPTGVTAVTGDSRATVSWTAPAANGSAITTYVVQYSSDGGTTWTTFTHTASTATSIDVTGLTNGVTYVFQVAAVNGIGTGNFSASSNAVSPTSADATLTSLATSTGSLSPSFSSSTVSYTVSVANDVTSITVTAVLSQAGSTMTVNGVVTLSGQASASITLAVGSNSISIAVTAPNGTTTVTYTVNVTRAAGSTPQPAPDNGNSLLSSITSGSGGSAINFSTSITSYSVTVGNSTTVYSLSALSLDPGSTISINGSTPTTGSASGQLQLNVGSNTFVIVVTSRGGAVTTYTVTVNRSASNVSTLSALTLSAGATVPGFSPTTTAYTVTVTNAVTSLSVTPYTTDPTATIAINGQSVKSGQASEPFGLATGENSITVVVTAQNGSLTAYSLRITRMSAPPTPVLPVLTSDPVTNPIPGGLAQVKQDGLDSTRVLISNGGSAGGINVTDPLWSLSFTGKLADGTTIGLDANGRLKVVGGTSMQTQGTGFMPNTQIRIYIFSTPMLVGTVTTDARGAFSTVVGVPANLPAGDHTVQVLGYTDGGKKRSVSVPLMLQLVNTRVFTSKYYFAPDSAAITRDSLSTMTKLVSAIGKNYSNLKASVFGFTFSKDTKVNSVTLSKARALAITNKLKMLGLKGAFTATGKGRAPETNATARRVEVTINVTITTTS